MQLFAIKKDAVFRFAMLVQSFAVIGHQHDHRAVVNFLPFQIVDELTDDRIGRGDLAVIRRRRVSAPVWLGRRVRRMRLEEMQQKKERAIALLADPTLRDCGGRCAVALQLALRFAAAHFDGVVIKLERVLDSGRAAKNVRRDRRAGCVTVLVQQ